MRSGRKKTTRTLEKMEIGEKKSPKPRPARDPGRARAQASRDLGLARAQVAPDLGRRVSPGRAQTKPLREPRPRASEVSSLSL